jgi:tetratricopeptide (TPR) repeat protein
MHGGSLLATTFTMLPVFCRYLGMLLWPASLSAEYNPPVHQSLDGAVSAAFLLFMAVAWGGWRLYRYDRRLGFWVAFFFVALLPVSQIVPLFTLMNDRYLYFPILSVALFCGVGADALLNSLHMSPRLVRLLVAIPLLLLSLLSYERAGVWRNSVTLWSDAVAKVPDSSRIWGHLGNAHAAASNYRLAMDAFSRGLELDPENDQILYSSGAMYLLLGDNQQAYTLLKKLVDLLPNHIMGLVSFGDVCVKRGEYAEAEKNYLTAHNLQPDAVEPLIALGNTAVITDRLADARTYFLQAEKVDEGHPDIAYNMACVESMSGRIDSALAWLEKALQRGYGDEYDLRTNRELAMVRADIRFEQILTRYFSEH